MKSRIKNVFYIGIAALLLGACSADNEPNPNGSRAEVTTPPNQKPFLNNTDDTSTKQEVSPS